MLTGLLGSIFGADFSDKSGYLKGQGRYNTQLANQYRNVNSDFYNKSADYFRKDLNKLNTTEMNNFNQNLFSSGIDARTALRLLSLRNKDLTNQSYEEMNKYKTNLWKEGQSIAQGYDSNALRAWEGVTNAQLQTQATKNSFANSLLGIAGSIGGTTFGKWLDQNKVTNDETTNTSTNYSKYFPYWGSNYMLPPPNFTLPYNY